MTTDIALTNPAQTGEKKNENEERGNLRVDKGQSRKRAAQYKKSIPECALEAF
jgi:hypothetical protein